jgi:RHS repeat-associated protein
MNGSIETNYLDGFQYDNRHAYDTSASLYTIPALKFIPTSEGYFNFENNKYIYNYTDHLGNVRVSYFNNGSSIEVLEESNYYPFGLKHGISNPSIGNPSYNYKYNGKELQETGMYDYGARFYMPDLGRWGVIDPLAEKMTRHNPYNYAFNNPLSFIDPDGRAPDWHKDGKGNLVADVGDSAGTLATYLGTGQQNAEKLLESQGYSSYEKDGEIYTQINEGSKVQVTFSKLEQIDGKAYDKVMNDHGYEKADIVQVDKVTNTEFSTDRSTHKNELGYQQVGGVKQEYVKKGEVNTHKQTGADIEYFAFSNTIRVHNEYVTPLGKGSSIVSGLNQKHKSPGTRLKSEKGGYKELLQGILEVIKKKK